MPQVDPDKLWSFLPPPHLASTNLLVTIRPVIPESSAFLVVTQDMSSQTTSLASSLQPDCLFLCLPDLFTILGAVLPMMNKLLYPSSFSYFFHILALIETDSPLAPGCWNPVILSTEDALFFYTF